MKVLMKGNEALAESRHPGGLPHFFGYPITPQTELAAYMSKRHAQDRRHLPAGRIGDRRGEYGAGLLCRRPAGHDLLLLPRHQPQGRGHLLYGRL